jgi:hypothetical protein
MAAFLKYSVSPMDREKMGIVKSTRSPAPLYSARKPSFLYATSSPWKMFRYPYRVPYNYPPFRARSARWICIRNFTISSGVVRNPETAPAPAEQRMLSPRLGLA